MLTPAPLIARLPAPLQQRLRDLGNGARGLFGAQRETQAIFDASIALLDALIAGGAARACSARLLAEVGVARPDGRPLSRGTVSSALCRARERAAAAPAAARSRRKARRPADLRPAAAASHGAPQSAAGDCISPQRAAALRSGTQQGSARAGGRADQARPPVTPSRPIRFRRPGQRVRRRRHSARDVTDGIPPQRTPETKSWH